MFETEMTGETDECFYCSRLTADRICSECGMPLCPNCLSAHAEDIRAGHTTHDIIPPTNEVAWTAENGKKIVITATAGDFLVSVDGRQVFSGLFDEVPAALAKRAAAAGIVATLGPAGLTTERRDALRAMRKAMRAAKAAYDATPEGQAAVAYAALSEQLAALYAEVEDAQYHIQRHDENPGFAYAAHAKAKAAHAAWIAAHPAYMAERAAKIAAEWEAGAAEREAARIRFENAD